MVEEARRLAEENVSLDVRLNQGGFVQNLMKQEIVPQFRSPALSRRLGSDERAHCE